jgi:dTDP-4-dehydrorhamnose reductase
MSRRVLILGGGGLLGRALLRSVPSDVNPVVPVEDELPLEEPARIEAAVRAAGADRLLLLAAWTAVDACESDPERAFRVNGVLAGEAAGAAARAGAATVFLSTDYVFDGEARAPYRESDPVGPRGVYARSKWDGECRVRAAAPDARVVRTSGLYGPGGPDFVQTILGALDRGPVEVVTDEVNAPTFVDDLAPALWTLALAGHPGTWHLAAGGGVSRFELARRIAEWSGLDAGLVRPTTRARFGRPAPRPAYSVLDCSAARSALGLSLPAWEDGLDRFIRDLKRAATKGRMA